MVNSVNNIGQKAKNLKILSEKFPDLIPRFLTIEIREFFSDWDNISERLEYLAGNYLQKRLSLTRYEEKLSAIINEAETDKNFLRQLENKLLILGFKRVSYRTSTSQEDLEKSSFAGQYLTLLDKDTKPQTIEKSLRECTKSLFSPRVLGYLRSRGRSYFNQCGSVVIQEMFYGEASGVIFTENGQNEIELSYTFSWRNTTVEGDLTNNFFIKKSKLKNRNNLPKDLPNKIVDIIKAAIELELDEGKPLDIEWSVNKERAALLQFRPITTRSLEYVIEWDNTNIAESYPGITLPLTYSFIRGLYSKVYPEFLKLLGRSEPSLAEYNHIFENMLGYINGRVYYNINNWYELIRLLPGYKYNKEFFESMLMPAKKQQRPLINRSKLSFLEKLQVSLTAIRFIWLLLRTNSLSNKFTKKYLSSYKVYKSLLWNNLAADEIVNMFDKIERDLLQQWAIPILNDFRTMVFHGLLRKLFFPKANDRLYTQLLSGIYDHTSVEPIRQLSYLANEMKTILQNFKGSGEHLVKAIKNHKQFDDFRSKIKKYLADYGGRSPDELKLENPRLGETLESFISFLISTAKGHQDKTFSIQTPIDSRKIVRKLNFGHSFLKGTIMKWLFKFILYQAKSGISKRERFRLYRAEVFGLARNAFLALGRRFIETKLITNQDDIFYLTKSEISDLVLGHAFEDPLKEKINKRKKLFKSYSHKNLGRRLISSGLIAPNHTTIDRAIDSKNKLSGLGVSKGIFRGRAVVLKEFNPKVDVKGKILVTEHTDPGWTLLFLNASALVVERGNALSHASIVAREIGIPAVVAVESACDILRNDQKIVVNGNTGEVAIL